MKKKILVTGASGFVGGLVYKHFAADVKNFETLALDRSASPSARVPQGSGIHFPAGKFFCEDLATSDRLEEIFKGVDVIAHLAADPRIDAPGEAVERDNVLATQRLYRAASRSGVKKVILASTSFLMAGYARQEPFKSIEEGRRKRMPFFSRRLTHGSAPRPIGEYAASKVICEDIARDHAERFGIDSLCVRIGAVTPNDTPSADPRWRAWWCSQRDLTGIFEKAARYEGLSFDIFFGVSKNRSRWVDLGHAKKVLGFIPQDGAS